MNFSSSLFLLYFLPFFLVIYYLSGHRYRNKLVAVSSIVFFMWGAPSFTFLLLASIMINHYLGGVMHAVQGQHRKTLLYFLIIANVALLLYFKYTGFFIDQFNTLLSLARLPGIPAPNILLPLGISFITFQQVSYLIDVYRNTSEPAQKVSDYALFVLFFPKILAGPIIRYKEFYPQLADRGQMSGMEDRIRGFFRFSLGLFKKVMIANTLGIYADEIFATAPFLLDSKTAWLGALAYSFQIYFDFSAYSDMAIGLARMMGFHIKENFNNPYISSGIIEFWKRWHITLGTWLRDYLFLPLAYVISRRLPRNSYFGIKTDLLLYISSSIITMLICGFWHGAGWTFIIWGMYHGLLMALEKAFLSKVLKRTGRVFPAICTFFLVTLGWVLFRADSTQYALGFYLQMFSFSGINVDYVIQPQLIILLVASAIFSLWALIPGIEKRQMQLYTEVRSTAGLSALTAFGIILFVIGLSQVTATGFNPFIYFRF